MDAAAAFANPPDAGLELAATPANHKYGTRTRQNSVMRPSARLRQEPDLPIQPRKIRPAAPLKHKTSLDASAPPVKFPPENVVLHQEDATSKVFLAIGRALMSIDNRAVTIKDLAEMTVRHGIGSQSASAASQAITTYIRNHRRRCDEEEDVPLLLSHNLSGTPSDDDLLQALYSRVGGAHCGPDFPEGRKTNFRKGTVVWYLSKAAGAPCPFARASIRICEYSENGRTGAVAVTPKDPRERRRERDRARRALQAQCGQKRKRLARACAERAGADSDSEADGPPPKVKLTLRLPPSTTFRSSSPPAPFASIPARPHSMSVSPAPDTDCSESDSDASMDSDSSDESDDDESPCPATAVPVLPVVQPQAALEPKHLASNGQPRRSPSVPHSVGSNPPDSEAEDEGFHIGTMDRWRSSSREATSSMDEDEDDWHQNFQDDDATDTTWGESPGPLSPPPVVVADPAVKLEQSDVRGMLDAWDDYDKRVADSKVVEIVARAAADALESTLSKVKTDPLEALEWEQYDHPSPGWETDLDKEDAVIVKQEELDQPELSPISARDQPHGPLSPVLSFAAMSLQSPTVERGEPVFGPQRRPSVLGWQDVKLLGPDSVHPAEFEDREWQQSPVCPRVSETTRPREGSTASATPCSNTSSVTEASEASSWGSKSLSSSTSAPPSRPISAPVHFPSVANRFVTSMSAIVKDIFPPARQPPSAGAPQADTDPATPREKPANKRDSASSIRTIVPAPDVPSPWEVTLQQVQEDLLSTHPPFPVLPTDHQPLSLDSLLMDTPLSPQEEEIFQSFCHLPEDSVPVPPEAATEPKSDMEIDASDAEEAAPPPRRSTRLASTRPAPPPKTRATRRKATR